MKKGKRPSPIKIKHSGLIIECVGLNSDDGIPYLRLEDGYKKYVGVVEDRDLKRLIKWAQACLKAIQ